jgi:hypothetical protein
MSLHHGEIIERVIRRGGHSITNAARILNVERRTIYNWFNHQKLKHETIYQIGHALRHDFSVEFPDYFTPNDFKFDYKHPHANLTVDEAEESEESLRWKEKYLALEERHARLREHIFGVDKTG